MFLNLKHRMLESEKEMIYHSSPQPTPPKKKKTTNQKKACEVNLMTDKIDFRARSTTRARGTTL